MALLAALGCSTRLDLPQEPETTGNPGGEVAYVKKYLWEEMQPIADLVLTRGQSLYGVADSSAVLCWFSDTALPRLNPGRSIPLAVLGGDTLRGPVRICEGSENTLWVAYRSPQPTIVQWDIAVTPPAVAVDWIRDANIGGFGGIAADPDSDFIYVADAEKSTIAKYAPSASGGHRVTVLATQGNGDFFVQQPGGLYYFSDSLLVADTGKSWLQVMHADVAGAGRGQVRGPADDPLQLRGPADVWVDASGYYYVAESDGARVLKLTREGAVKEIVTEYDPEAAEKPNTLAASDTEVWVVDPERSRLTIYQINTEDEELP